MTEIPTWFGAEDRPAFGILTVPDSGTARLGVLLCTPMTEEARAAHRTFRTLATSLAERGIASLRFDYRGTGDSAGLLTDEHLVADWQDDIAAAARLLRDAGVTELAAVGMRLGATLAAGAVETIAPRALVLWDPCSNGSKFLREGQALHAVRADPTAAASGPSPDGVVDTPGFRFGAELAAQVRTLTVAGLATASRRPERTLVLTRQDRPVPKELQRALDYPGVEFSHAVGQAELLDAIPLEARVPRAAVGEIVDWLDRVSDGLPAMSLTCQPRDQITLRIGERAVRERTVHLGPIGLFGIETVPANEPATGAPWLVFLNVATEHHIGPSRQWVELARDWAALGFRCVRLDQSSVGDSPTHPGQHEDAIFAGEWLTDGRDVVTQLRSDGSDVVLVGLCSGAHTAMEAALLAPVTAILSVNVQMSEPRMSKGGSLYHSARRAARPPIAPLGRIARRNRIVGGGMWRIYRQFAAWNAPMAAASDVLRTGTELVLLANPRDAREFREVAAWTLFRVPFMRRTGRFRMILRDEVDHSMLTQAGQQTVRRIFTDFLRSRYPAVTPAPVLAPTAGTPATEPVDTSPRVG